MTNIIITNTDPQAQARAEQLATQLNLTYKITPNAEDELVLEVSSIGLQLRSAREHAILAIDFISGRLAHRQQVLSRKNELLIQALGKGSSHQILDLTAGLGRDSFLMASRGHQVVMLERNPILACLLSDALTRMHAVQPDLTLKVIHADAKDYLLQQPEPCVDIIYLDPMHPTRNKSALVKAPLRIIRTLVGEDLDSAALLPLAMQYARQRVVVKRPRTAPPLADLSPSYSVTGKHTRFDIY